MASSVDYFGARYYASSLGRFLTPDPLGGHLEDPQTLNKYAYVENNSVTLTDPTGLDFYLSCQHSDKNAASCEQETVGYDGNGNAQRAWVQGVTGNGQFTATRIGNGTNGGLMDLTTGTGAYTGSVNGSEARFSNNGGQTSSTGVFINGTPATSFQDAGWANGGALSGFNYTFTNSKLEANQTAAGTFSFAGSPQQAGAALRQAGYFQAPINQEPGTGYRSWGSAFTGADSGHFILSPSATVPSAGQIHFGEHDPFMPPLGLLLHCTSDGAPCH